MMDSPDETRGSLPTVRFSVVSAVYNVAKYIDEFIESVVAQSIGFAGNIQLVLVDDGSSDGSAKRIRYWQKKYPANIHSLRQENGGPAAARNAGLKLASGEWVTFTDPDDFVAPDYFARVDRAIREHRGEVGLVSCALIVFNDARKALDDSHPLRFRFADGTKVVPAAELGRFIQLHVNSAFFRRDIILKTGLTFDERVRPVFEDASFACRYTLYAGGTDAIFLPEAKYLYRRRADGSSLLQTASTKVEMCTDKVRYGYLNVLQEAARVCGRVPRHIQLTVLYALSWDLGQFVDNVGPMPILTAEQRATYIALLHEVFRYIDTETVLSYDVHSFPTAFRVGLLNLFKPQFAQRPAVEVTNYDPAAKLIGLRHPSGRQSVNLQWLVDGVPAPIAYRKVRRSQLMDEIFLWEHIAWVPMPGAAARVSVTIDGAPAVLTAADGELGREASASDLVRALAPRVPPEPLLPEALRQLRSLASGQKAREAFADAWLFMDRDSAAEDNAEFLYRHVRQERPDINAWFILKRGSPDWQRLTADGFRLIGFHEPEHALALLNASYLISSQADHYVTSYLPRQYFGDRLKYRFVFLQHGILRSDLSGWLNGLNIDLMITTTRDEHQSIVADGTPYRFTSRECVLTGLPRHDALLAAPDEPSAIVIMPTWRSSLTGMALGPGNARSVNPAFFESEFARRWKSLLRSDTLRALAEAFNVSVVFIPHPNMEQYLRSFDLPKFVHARRFGGGQPMQGLFRSMAAFVTDYSSMAFEAAYLEKPVVSYQFDREEFYSGMHISRAGYFDFEKDGFGPVCFEEDEVLRVLEMQLRAGRPDEVYLGRAQATFPFRDGRCSQRVLDAIMAMGRAP